MGHKFVPIHTRLCAKKINLNFTDLKCQIRYTEKIKLWPSLPPFFSLLGGDPDDLAGPVHDESYLARKKNKHAGMPHDRRWRAVVPLPN